TQAVLVPMSDDGNTSDQSGAPAQTNAGASQPVIDMKTLVDQYMETGMSRKEALDHCSLLWMRAQIASGVPASVSTGARLPSMMSAEDELKPGGMMSVRQQVEDKKRIFGTLVKLEGRKNWATWRLQITNQLTGMPIALDHLFGREHDNGFSPEPHHQRTPGYDHQLDVALGTLLVQTLGDVGVAPIMLMQSAGENRASVFYKTLSKHYEWADAATMLQIQTTLGSLRQGDHTVEQLGLTFTHWFQKAVSAGLPLSESQKCTYLYSALHPRFSSWIQTQNTLRSNGFLDNYDHQMALLAGEELRLNALQNNQKSLSAQAFAVAFQASGYTPPSSSRSGFRGGRGSARGKSGSAKRSGRCHNCKAFGHWKDSCPQPPRDEAAQSPSAHDVSSQSRK
ncbi:hypothetical protein OC845_006891, partial [Tilletia horrida]